MRNHERIIRPNWHIVTGESPDSVHRVMEVLADYRYRVMSSDPKTWAEFFTYLSSDHFDREVPVFFDRSVEDAKLHRDGERIDIEKITLKALDQYKWRNAYIIEEASSSDISRTPKLEREYLDSGILPIRIPSDHSVEQADLIIRHYEQQQLENMPTMGS